jgi:hypothetical protein
MRWRKLGRVYVASGEAEWMQRRAYLPTPVELGDGRIRVYVAFLDRKQVGRVGFVDVDGADPTRVENVSQTPALDVGEPGEFDDNGVNPVSVVAVGGETWLYYIGWQLGRRVPYLLFCGLARSRDASTFERHARVPVLERSDPEPTLRSAAFVLPAGAGGFRAWYVTGRDWVESRGRRRPSYGICYAESPDGVSWPAAGRPCLAPALPDEYGFGRPYVVEDGGLLRMWYSIRSHTRGYRLGYAESVDGVEWTRLDDRVGIDVSSSGWDSEMIHCGSVLRAASGSYLFYNGNGYGETGFGVAVADGGVH